MKKLLVFDCEEEIAISLKEIFEEKGYQVSIAASPEEVIEKVESENPEVMLLDLILHTNFDSEALIRRIQKISPNTKIIVTTAIDKELQVQRALNAGAVRCVPKPCAIEDLERILEETMEGKAADPNWRWETNIGDSPPQY